MTVLKSVCDHVCVCSNVLRNLWMNPVWDISLSSAEAQFVPPTCVTDSTPFHKNVVQPPTKTHTQTHTFGAPVPQEQYIPLYEAIDPCKWVTRLCIVFLFAVGTHWTWQSTVTVCGALSSLAPAALHYLHEIWCCHSENKLRWSKSHTVICCLKWRWPASGSDASSSNVILNV